MFPGMLVLTGQELQQMVGEVFTKRNRCALVEKDAHSSRFKRSDRVLKHRAGLRERDARKTGNKVRDFCPVFEILEQRGNRNARAAKNPRATHALGVTFNGWAGRPINHAVIVGPAWRRLNVTLALSRLHRLARPLERVVRQHALTRRGPRRAFPGRCQHRLANIPFRPQ